MDGLFEDLFGDIVKGGQKVVTETGSKAIEDLLRSGEFGKVLDKVEEKAREGVKAEAKKNALNLAMLAVATGAIGGAVLRGKAGMVIAAGITVFAISRIVGGQEPAKPKRK